MLPLPSVFLQGFAGKALRLYLLRHAKSDWGNKNLDDFDRPLSQRGIAAAPRIGAYMRTRKYVPSLVKCSSSQRTRETLAHIMPFFEPAPEIHYSRSLYLAEPKALLEDIRRTPDVSSTLLLVGHNPGVGALALALTALPKDRQEEIRNERLSEKFPTACLAVLDFDVTKWRAVKPLSGELVDYMRAKDLRDTVVGAEERNG
jgi:phosphohistidine phosphatase